MHQCSDLAGLDDKARSGTLAGYIGFDCTAPSLHVGNLVGIMMLHWLQETGGKPVALMGGGTTMVGDPSGKDESRKLLTIADIEANKAGIRKAFAHFIRFGDGKHDAIMPDNADWLAKLNYIEFLRDVGRHFSVNRMLAMDSVKLRLSREHELTFLEFNYMCLQAYDFAELNKRYGVTLQMGGSDQWGNIVTGIDLGRRMGLEQLYALTTPLITMASGAKMGKTAAGAVWLDETMLAPYDYWQFWRNVDDADVGRFLKLFTLLPLERNPPARKPARRRDQRSEEGAGQRGDRASAWARGRRRRGGHRPQDLRGRRARRKPADGRRAGVGIRRRAWRADRLRSRWAGRLDRRSAPSDPRRRLEDQRRCARRRKGAHHPRGAEDGRRQAVARPQEARAAQGGLSYRAGRCAGISTACAGSGAPPRLVVPSIAPRIRRKIPGAIADSGLTVSVGPLIAPCTR